MLTVLQAARRLGKNPETIRRWIRSGRLRAQKVGNQRLIDEDDLAGLTRSPSSVPPKLERTRTDEPMPDWVELVRELRASR
jgi:excisionase family DNA binding protein